MANKVTLKDYQGVECYPKTHEQQILTGDGSQTLDEKLTELESELGYISKGEYPTEFILFKGESLIGKSIYIECEQINPPNGVINLKNEEGNLLLSIAKSTYVTIPENFSYAQIEWGGMRILSDILFDFSNKILSQNLNKTILRLRPRLTYGKYINTSGNIFTYDTCETTEFLLLPDNGDILVGLNYLSKGAFHTLTFFDSSYKYIGGIYIEEANQEDGSYVWNKEELSIPENAVYFVIIKQISSADKPYIVNILSSRNLLTNRMIDSDDFAKIQDFQELEGTVEDIKVEVTNQRICDYKSINMVNLPYKNGTTDFEKYKAVITPLRSSTFGTIISSEFIDDERFNLKLLKSKMSAKQDYVNPYVYKIKADDFKGWDKSSKLLINLFLGGFSENIDGSNKKRIQNFISVHYGISEEEFESIDNYSPLKTTDKMLCYVDSKQANVGEVQTNNPDFTFDAEEKKSIIEYGNVVKNLPIYPFILDGEGRKLYFTGIAINLTTLGSNIGDTFITDYPVVVSILPINSVSELPLSFIESNGTLTKGVLVNSNGKIKEEFLPYSPTDAISEHTLTVQNSDKIAFYGCSYTESYYAIKKKSWINKLSNMLDIQLANFGVSGNRIVDICKRIRENKNPYHSFIGIKEIRPTYIAIQNIGNETLNTSGNNLDFYLGEIEEAAELVKSYGAKLLLGTDWMIGNPSVDSLLRDYANQNGCLYWGVGSISEKILANKYDGFWGGGHPATRTNATIWQEYLNFLNNLGIRQCIKVYRIRDEFKGGSPNIEDLNYDTISQRMVKWNEINVGEIHLSEESPGWEYYDRLDQTKNGGGWAYNATKSDNEYCNLIAKQNVAFNNWSLVELILPFVKTDNVKVFVKSDSADLKFYIKESADKSYQYGVERNYCMFKVDKETYDSFNSILTDVQYKSSSTEEDVLKYKGRLKGQAYPGYYLCFYNSTSSKNADGEAGTLTPSAGGEPISYISASSGLGKHSYGFFESYLKPLSDFKEVEASYNSETGYFELNITDYKYIQYDKLRVIIGKTGNFNISDIYCTIKGGIEKRIDKNIFKSLKQQGTELTKDTGFGNTYNDEWELSEGAEFGNIPTEINQYPGFHSSYKSFIKLGYDGENFPGVIKKVFTIEEARGYRDLIIRVTARLFPKVYDTTKPQDDVYTNVRQITDSSYDLATLCLGLKMGNKTPAVLRKLVDVGWAELEFNTCVPPFVTNLEVSLWRDEKDLENVDYKSSSWPLQVCDISVQIL